MKSRLLFFAALLTFAPLGRAHDDQIVGEMTHAAEFFLGALKPEQKAKVQFGFTDAERKKLAFHPRVRKGLPIKEIEPAAATLLAQALLVTGLSSRGYGRAMGIMSLEEVLGELEKGTGPVRDPENYYFSIFGEPGGKEPWGWRFEGHHLSLNFAVGSDVLSMTPSFFGTNPGEVREGPRKGTRFLAEEEDLGRAFVKSLDEGQRKQAIVLGEAPKDILNVPGRNDRTNFEGIAQSKLTPEQQAALTHLIHAYLDRNRMEFASEEWAKAEKAGVEKIFFAWAGGIEPGQPHYYRVQGPTFVLEYDNTQNNANHVHTVWRTFDGDFGEDLLKKHYEEAHAPK